MDCPMRDILSPRSGKQAHHDNRVMLVRAALWWNGTGLLCLGGKGAALARRVGLTTFNMRESSLNILLAASAFG
ncbi:hypothetical protein NSND_60164 [Nitrospira sp. ND1]|nr:hypothetical protein NSND_60164 [Nitrospira sp. ND1]